MLVLSGLNVTSQCFDKSCNFYKFLSLDSIIFISFDDAVKLVSSANNPVTHVHHQYHRKDMFYLTTHSTHFIYGYMASDIW